MAGKRILWLFLFCAASLIAVYVGKGESEQAHRAKAEGDLDLMEVAIELIDLVVSIVVALEALEA